MGLPAVHIHQALILLVLFLVITIHARPSTPFEKDNILIAQDHHSSTSPNTPPSTFVAQQYKVPTTSHALHRRMLPNGPTSGRSGAITRIFGHIVCLAPITQAAKFLEGFFSDIAINAGGEWSTLPERSVFAIEEGSFRLSFNCIGDTIPWSFVKEIGNRLWEVAAMGGIHLFEGVFADEAATIAVQVTLSIIEDSAGSNSGQDWREGSVPSLNSGIS